MTALNIMVSLIIYFLNQAEALRRTCLGGVDQFTKLLAKIEFVINLRGSHEGSFH